MPNAATLAHLKTVAKLQAIAVGASRRAWAKVDPGSISESWAVRKEPLNALLGELQHQVALSAAAYSASALAEQGTYEAPQRFVAAKAFTGWVPDISTGLYAIPTSELLLSPPIKAKEFISSGMSVDDALLRAGSGLDLLMVSGIADIGRQAASVDIMSRPNIGYVRQLVGASCPRCVILAGRWYRWNAGFDRHPHDDCVHVPSRREDADQLTVDPYAHFESLSTAEQNRLWGAGKAQAIRDGADIGRVTNSARGVRKGSTGIFTTEATGRRSGVNLKPRQRRLTPEGIYKMYPKRADALKALEEHGYILPGGQNPLGAIKGVNYEGFGALGHGGDRRAAREAVLAARESGMRAGDRYTMTAAERRFYDAANDWAKVQKGLNPWANPGFTTVPDPYGRNLTWSGGPKAPLTPEIAAVVEKQYRNAVQQAIRDAISARRHG